MDSGFRRNDGAKEKINPKRSEAFSTAPRKERLYRKPALSLPKGTKFASAGEMRPGEPSFHGAVEKGLIS